MTARWVDHFAVGIHSARPAASAVPKGAMYSCTTHGLIYQSDGSSTWSTWATLGTALGNDLTLVEETTPSSPSAGSQKLFIDSIDHKVKRVNSSGTVTTVEGGGGAGSVAAATVAGSGSGDLSTVSTTFVDVTGMSLTIAATAGQKLLCIFTGSTFNTTTGDNHDITLNIGGTDRVDQIAVSAGTTIALPNVAHGVYTVVSGDISGGNVTVKLRWKTSAHTAFMINSSGRLPQLSALNIG